MKHKIEYLLFLISRFIIQSMPLKSAQRFGRAFGDMGYAFSYSRRMVAIDNLMSAFPDKPLSEIKKIARGSFRNFGIAFMELLWFPRITDEVMRSMVIPRNIELINLEHARGKGLILLSGHYGNWELTALAGAYLSKIPFNIIVQTQNNKLVDEAINRHRCYFGNTVVPMGMSVREVIRTLNDKGVIAIAPDQSGDRVGGLYLEFFGRTTATHQGPAAFALRSGAPLLMGFLIRGDDFKYTLQVERIDLSDLSGTGEEAVAEATKRHLAMLEKYIRLHPDHWLWMHKRWKHTR